MNALRNNCAEFGIELYDVQSPEQGIVHVIGPELGATKPGMTIVCGDSHTSTHGAFGALAFGIGTSEVEHVLATQTLPQSRPKTFRIKVEGKLPNGVTAKDIVLGIIGHIGTDGATGYVIEYAGSAIRALSMEGRHDHLQHEHRGRRACRHDRSRRDHLRLPERTAIFTARRGLGRAVAHWRSLRSDDGAAFDRELAIDAAGLAPIVTWGTSREWLHVSDAMVPSIQDAPAKPTARAWRAPSNIWP